MSTPDIWADALMEAENPEQLNTELWVRGFTETDATGDAIGRIDSRKSTRTAA